MALSFSANFLPDGSADGIPIARCGQKIIYYVSCPIDIVREQIHPQDGFDLIYDLINTTMARLQISGVCAKQINDINHSIFNGMVPHGDIAKKIYYEVKNELSSRESKFWRRRRNEPEIQLIPPCTTDQRTAMYITGSSGSYKSTHASRFSVEWLACHPHGRIFLFSQKKSDKAYDSKIRPYVEGNGGLIRVPINASFLQKIQSSDDTSVLDPYSHSLLIFDDIESILDPDLSRAIFHFKDLALNMGRSVGIDVISILHKALSGKLSKVEFNESTILMFFPWKNAREIRASLKTYCSFTPDEINRILDTETKSTEWLAIVKPRIIVTKDYIKIID
jgi:hypothetical protein